jgi:hypothetical protein
MIGLHRRADIYKTGQAADLMFRYGRFKIAAANLLAKSAGFVMYFFLTLAGRKKRKGSSRYLCFHIMGF